jgi:hypothetical protein
MKQGYMIRVVIAKEKRLIAMVVSVPLPTDGPHRSNTPAVFTRNTINQ